VKIGIDTMVTPTLKTGVGRYIDGLLTGLVELNEENEYLIFSGRNQEDPPRINGSRIGIYHSSVSTEQSLLNFFWKTIVLPLLVRKESIDVLHIPNEKPVFFKSRPTVMTFHDIADFRLRRRYAWRKWLFRRLVLPRTVRNVDHIIAVSQKTRTDIVELLGIPPQRITVIHEAAAPEFRPIDKAEARSIVATRWGVSGNIVLFVGEIDVRKNLTALIGALDLVINRWGLQSTLFIAGKNGRGLDALKADVRRRNLDNSVVFGGYVTPEELLALYNAARMLVLPSLYEGFGLPVLEAMACGTPVVASRCGSLPEVVGDAGLLVDTAQPGALAEAIATLLTDPQARNRLIEAGFSRAREFSWTAAARATIEVYRRVACR
jgi:glycosyltransferase involved in cell wall biosynthesis